MDQSARNESSGAALTARQRASARNLAQEFERALLIAYQQQAQMGQVRAFDMPSDEGPITCLWMVVPSDVAVQIAAAINGAFGHAH